MQNRKLSLIENFALVSEDQLHSIVDMESGCRVTRKILRYEPTAGGITRRLVGDCLEVVQDIVEDPNAAAPYIVTRTSNRTCTNLVLVDSRETLAPDPASPHSRSLYRCAVEISGSSFVRRTVSSRLDQTILKSLQELDRPSSSVVAPYPAPTSSKPTPPPSSPSAPLAAEAPRRPLPAPRPCLPEPCRALPGIVTCLPDPAPLLPPPQSRMRPLFSG